MRFALAFVAVVIGIALMMGGVKEAGADFLIAWVMAVAASRVLYPHEHRDDDE